MTYSLVLDAASARGVAAVVAHGRVLAVRSMEGRQAAAGLAALAQSALEAAGVTTSALGYVAVTVGPGSFTGLRAALSLAHGIGLAAGIPVLGATVGDAFRAEAPDGRPVWVALDTKRGQVFLDCGGRVSSVPLDLLPMPPSAVSIAGDAAVAVASRLAARGADVLLLAARRPCPAGIAAAASIHKRPAQPLYVDPPEARPGPPIRPLPC